MLTIKHSIGGWVVITDQGHYLGRDGRIGILLNERCLFCSKEVAELAARQYIPEYAVQQLVREHDAWRLCPLISEHIKPLTELTRQDVLKVCNCHETERIKLIKTVREMTGANVKASKDWVDKNMHMHHCTYCNGPVKFKGVICRDCATLNHFQVPFKVRYSVTCPRCQITINDVGDDAYCPHCDSRLERKA